MKILVLTNLFPTPWDPLRGAFNRQQFERLGRRHEVHVLTAVDFRERWRGTRHELRLANLVAESFTFYYPPRIGRALHAACWAASLWLQRGRALRAAGYDCVLASWAYPDAVAARWLARRLGLPCVVKVHGSDLNVLANFALRRRQISRMLRDADGVVAVSRALADKAVALGASPASIEVIYNGVDSALFAPGSRAEARERLGLEADAPLLLYVGNLKVSKGCLELIGAFPAVLRRHPRAQLVYVGSGECRAELLRGAAEAGCGGRVRLHGSVAHDQLGDWFRAADLLCLPSYNEGVPNVVLEAMASGTPVVATRVGGIPEVLPADAGILVPPRDAAALAAALLDALGRAWDRAWIARHASAFRWDDNIDKLERVLRRAMANRSHPTGYAT